MGRFDGFEKELRGPWEPTWYSGVVIAEYEAISAAFGSKVHKTEDRPSQDGSSRNLKLCISLVDGKTNQSRNVNWTINYRPEALELERIAELKELREENKGKQKWGGPNDQRDALTLSRFHALERAGLLGEEGKKNKDGTEDYAFDSKGNLDPDKIVGKAADFHINVSRMNGKNSHPVPEKEYKGMSDEEKATLFNKVTDVVAYKGKVK